MMTAAQRARLHQISEDARRCVFHPSEQIRISTVDADLIDRTLKEILDEDDGYRAFRIIRAFHVEGIKSVLGTIKDAKTALMGV